jgi:AcrR family transcriptional regulator
MQQRAEETRERIIKVAADSFARQGYDATGVAEICEGAGVSKGAFYHHFASKQAVFLELLQRWMAQLDERLESVRSEAGTVPEQLREMAGMMTFIFQSAEGQLPIFLEFWRQASRDSAVWQATMAPYRRYRDWFVKIVEAGIEEGSLRSVDADEAALALVALALGLILQGLLDPTGADWTRLPRQSMDMLLEGLETKSMDKSGG